LVVAVVILSKRMDVPEPTVPTPPTTEYTEPSTTVPITDETTIPQSTDPQPIEWMMDLYEQNPDILYWIKIDGTKLDYPVMYTPIEPERYLHKDFEGKYSPGGVPFMEDACSIDPESTNLIIYGHNMTDGSQFRTMMSYKNEEFWKEHPQIKLTSMYEERTFDILAVFYDQVYYKHQTDVFKFYKFIDPKTEAEFNAGINYFKNNSLYDTGVTAEFGDQLITLCTCSYHTDDGRFVIVAKEVVEEQEPLN
jgi:sortase B